MAKKSTTTTTTTTTTETKPATRQQTVINSAKPQGPFTLAIDVGGSGLKASVLDRTGAMTTERVRIDTPRPCDPAVLVDNLAALAEQLKGLGQRWDRISVGFPGLVRRGVVHTAPNIDTEAFAGFDLASSLATRLGAPTRVVNDADMQGLAAIAGKGVEMVCTLGTGFGTALFYEGRLQVHLEIAHLPFRKGETFDVQLGDAARKDVGNHKWRKRVHNAFAHMFTLTHYDRVYIGGGNAKYLEGEKLPERATLVDNSAGILGGIRLWNDSVGAV